MRIRLMCFLKLGAPNPEDLIKITSCPTPSNEAGEGNSHEKVIHPIDVQSTILNVYAEAAKQITGFRLKLCTLAGSQSQVDLILNRLNTTYIDFCSASTHVQNLSAPIPDFPAYLQRQNITRTMVQISKHLEPNCIEGRSLIDLAIGNPNLKYVSYDELQGDTFMDQFWALWNTLSKDEKKLTPISKITRQQVPDCIHRYLIKHQDSIAEWIALSPHYSSVDTKHHNKNAASNLCHLGGFLGKTHTAETENKLRQASTTWTEAELKILRDSLEELGTDWDKIAERIPGRSRKNIYDRWYSQERHIMANVDKVDRRRGENGKLAGYLFYRYSSDLLLFQPQSLPFGLYQQFHLALFPAILCTGAPTPNCH
jgi:hypothetical protein